MTARTVGIEEEFLLFRAGSAELYPDGPRVVASADEHADDDAQFEEELKTAQAELATAPSASLAAVGAELTTRRRELVAAAERHGARVVAIGLSPLTEHSARTPKPRYEQMGETFAAVEHNQVSSAMHVHVGVADDDEAVRVINGLTPWLPTLAALSVNSPFHRGRDTGYASFRRIQWGQWPTAGPTGTFTDAADYHRTVETLIDSGAAHDAGMIYFDARLSARYPTVEIRVCDVATEMDLAVALAALCRALVETVAAADPVTPDRVEVLRAAHWRAARFGLSDQLWSGGRLVPAWAAVDELSAVVEPALDETGDAAAVRAALDALRADGTGADRQRAAVARADGDVAAAVDACTLDPRPA